MTTYSISLDHVKLALLPLGAHSHNDFLKKEYFQFEVMTKETVTEPIAIILYTCHICAVEVPAAFASEHVASIKHRANARIANVATERTRALISALPPPFAEQSNAQFCANCTAIVGYNHDRTKKHRVAVLQDKLLWELMAAYVGDDNYEDGNLNSADISDDISDVENLSTNSNSNEEHKENSEDHNKLEIKNGSSDTQNKCDEKIQLKDIESNGQVVDSELIQIQNDNKDYNNVDNTLDHEIINIETRKNDSNNKLCYSIDVCNKIREKMERSARNSQVATQGKLRYDDFVPDSKKFVKVTTDHYHNFIGKVGKMECIVCKRTFDCDESLSRAFSLRHLIPSIMKDEMYVIKINDIYSHCNICNQIVKNIKVEDHKMTLHHQMNKVRKTVATTSNMYHDQTIASADGDNTSDKKQASQNVYNVKDQSEDTPEIKIKGTTTISGVKNSASRILPEVFKINTPEAGKEVKNMAINSKVKVATNWEERVNNKTKSSEVKNADNWTIFEEVLKTNTSEENANHAAESRTNDDLNFKKTTPIKRLKSTDNCSGVNYASDEVGKNKTPKEKVMDKVSIEKKNTPDENVIAGHSGVTLSNVAQTVGNVFEATDDKNTVRCVICDCTLPNTLENRNQHLTGTWHVNYQHIIKQRPYKPAKQENYVRCPFCDCTVKDTGKAKRGHFYKCHNAGNNTVSYPFEIKQPGNMLRCVICDCYVPNHAKNKRDHVQSHQQPI